MPPNWMLACLAGAFAIAVAVAGAARGYALRGGLIDHPNARGSHAVPTPRGGGIGIVVAFLLVMGVAQGWAHPLGGWHLAAFLGGGALVALIGFVDDHGHVPAWIRLAVHLAAAAGGLSLLATLPANLGEMPLGLWALPPSVVVVVWMINLYNFIDGIDGLAASQALFVGLVGGLFAWWGGQAGVALLAWTMAAGCAGFLLWNWPPAKIFMGDVGSGFLGYILGMLLFAGHAEAVRMTAAGVAPGAGAGVWVGPPAGLWPWAILLGVLITDATVTLTRRMLRGEAFWRPHRLHAYQHTSRRWGHLRVTVGAALINLLFLMPLAYVAWRWPDVRKYAGLVAYAALTPLVLYFGAGRPERPSEAKAD